MNARDINAAMDEQDGYDFAVEGEDLSDECPTCHGNHYVGQNMTECPTCEAGRESPHAERNRPR